MQRFDILDPSLNIFQSRLLEASAGTGKTFAIEHLVIRLLLESNPPLNLNEILAVTFTREAAHEMKQRIRSRLEERKGEHNPRVAQALVDFDQAQVFTIHGFCHRMLSDFAFEAQAPLKLNDPNKPHHLQEMRQTVEDFLRTADQSYAYDISILMKKARFDRDRCCQKIVDKMQKEQRAQTLEFPKLPHFFYEDLREDMQQLAPRYKRIKVEEIEPQLSLFVDYLQNNEWSKILEETGWFFEKMEESNVKVRAQPLDTIALKDPHFFDWLQQKLLPLLQKGRNPEEALKRVAEGCRDLWKVKASLYDHMTFDELLVKMKDALNRPSFLQKVQNKYKAVIVDEFQDTDPLQWAIFETLFLKNHLLYLVGDPKQSIYGFRNADIYTYMKAGKALGIENKAFLDTNFRSSPPLIDALNQLFTKRPEWIHLPNSPEALNYHPVKAGRSESKLEEAPLYFFGIKGGQGRERSWPTKTIEEEKIFPFIASEVMRLMQQQNIPLSQIAILIKDRYQAQRLQTHLDQWHIPSSIKRTFHLAQSRGFKTMEMILEALAYPDYEAKGRAVCLSLLNCDEKTPFAQIGRLVQEKGIASAITLLLTKYAHNCDPTLHTQLRQTLEILMAHSPYDLQELLALMRELKTTDPEMDERLKLQSQEDEEAVAIMTIFASKGLEFDVVFALSCASEISDTDPEKLAEHMRQLYVAFTRSREKLYIPCVIDADQKNHITPLDLFFQNLESLPIQWVESVDIVPLKKIQSQVVLSPPPETSFAFEKEYLTSFSAMAQPHATAILKERFDLQNPKHRTAHTLPLGAETGILIHTVFEKALQSRHLPLEQILLEVLTGTHLEGWEEIIYEMVTKIFEMPLFDSFSLTQLQEGHYIQEMEFLFSQGPQLVKGFIDLVFQWENKFYIIDWKTNWLGPSDSDYNETSMNQAIRDHDYLLQARLYKEAVWRYVKRLYICPEWGGVYYIFVRGKKGVNLGIS